MILKFNDPNDHTNWPVPGGIHGGISGAYRLIFGTKADSIDPPVDQSKCGERATAQ